MTYRFVYTGIRVRNLQRSLNFYTKALGMKVTRRGKMGHGGVYVALRSPRSTQELELNWYPPGSRFATPYRRGEEMDHLAFVVDDVEEAFRDLVRGEGGNRSRARERRGSVRQGPGRHLDRDPGLSPSDAGTLRVSVPLIYDAPHRVPGCSAPEERTMVYLRDDGIFDASIDKLWKYLQDPESHRHDSILSQKVMEQSGNTMKIRAEVKGPKGKEEQMWRMTMDPPFGFELEVLSGSQKGSTNTHTYVPMGDKTKVIVAGDFHVEGLDPAATKKATLDYYAMVFEEDNHAMKEL